MTEKNVRQVETVIIGSGFSGIGLSILLKKQGHDDFVVLEKAGTVGGCWRDNTYPGAACDVPSHLYSLSFEPNPDWKHRYSRQGDILKYMQSCMEKHGLESHMHFGQEVAGAEFDEKTGLWQVETRQGLQFSARFLVSACGQLSRPAFPSLPGIENFKGARFHSATWDHSFDLKGKRVAVIGTGASAIQFVPTIAPDVEHLTLFQRSAPYVLPKPDRPYMGWEKKMLKSLPVTQLLTRLGIYTQHESRILAFGPFKFLLSFSQWMWQHFMHYQVKDKELRKKLTPDYKIGCKRILISNDYYPALARDNVSVDTTGIAEVREHSIVDKQGVEHPVDAIIYGTGFKATEFLAPMNIKGLGGLDLNEAWRDGAEAFRGITVNNFPNLMMLYGPNTNIGHNSAVYIIESQLNYILDYMRKVRTGNLSYMNLRGDTQKAFNDKLQADLASSVWNSGGCTSWYVNEAGKNTNNWPGSTLNYRRLTRQVDLEDYEKTAS